MRPVQSGLRPDSARSTVDLPEPLSPTMPKLPPRGHVEGDPLHRLDARRSGREARRPRSCSEPRRVAQHHRQARLRMAERGQAFEQAARIGMPRAREVAGRAVPPRRGRRTSPATRSQKCETSGRSWLISIRPMPRRETRSSISRRISACTVASSALVGSSAISSSGSGASIIAIITRCPMPPESSCG